MAFQQPQQRLQAARQVSVSRPANETQTPASPSKKRTLEESQEWILFAPAQNTDSASHTSQTPRTATYLSELGSLETHVRSQPIASTADEGEGTCQGTEAEDDGAELDSPHTTLSLPRHTSWINLVEHFSQHMMDSVHSLPQPACRSNSGSLSDTIRTAEDM